MSVFDKLVGKKVSSLTLSQDKEYLTIVADGETFQYYTEGDCCSNSWIESIEGEDSLVGHTVVSVCDSNSENHDDSDEDTLIQVYFYKFVTTGGYCDIEMRNESNGYYGGWITELLYDGNGNKIWS